MLQNKYFHTYETHINLRWKNKPIIDVLTSEFVTRSREYYLEALERGVITVNDSIVGPNYKLKDLDLIKHTVHIHEPITPKIDVIAKEENYWVVNKPRGTPCHPTGGYFEYSVTRALFSNKSVGCVNRLDMPVSGTLILTFSNSDKVHSLLKDAQKIYIAKVDGIFPDYIEVDKPIGISSTKIHMITENGKPSKTIFKNIISKNGASLVLCQPITGRTHQIRIHLQYIGYPIINDVLYGKGKLPELTNDLDKACNEDISGFDDKEKYSCIIRHCKGANNRTFQLKDEFICYMHGNIL